MCSKVSVGLSTKDKSQGLITRIENKVDRVLKIRQPVISPRAQTKKEISHKSKLILGLRIRHEFLR